MRRLATLVAAVIVFAPFAAAQPQPAKGPPNALQGFSQNRDKPVEINAATLEVRDAEKTATFSGDVVVKQGDTTMRCKSLVVFYEQDGEKTKNVGMRTAKTSPTGEQRIKRLEARGTVLVTQRDQAATGEFGVFDMASNTVTLTGSPVVMTQGKNVVRGERLVVNLTTGVSRVESGKNGTRVQGLFQPGSEAPEVKPGGPVPVAPFR